MVTMSKQLLPNQGGLDNDPKPKKFAEYLRYGVYCMEALIYHPLACSRVVYQDRYSPAAWIEASPFGSGRKPPVPGTGKHDF